MTIKARPYCVPTDLANMRQLLMIGSQAGIPASYTHPGSMDWATHCPPDARGTTVSTIWFDPVNRVGPFGPVAPRPTFRARIWARR